MFNAPRTARLPFVSEPYEVNDKEFASVSGLEGRQRFEHLLKRICDTVTVCLLYTSPSPRDS